MPLNTEILRGGERLPVRWSGSMLNAFLTVAVVEALPEEPVNADKELGLTYGDLVEEVETAHDEWGDEIEVVGDCSYSERVVDFGMMPVYYMGWDVPLWKEGRQTLVSDHRYVVSTRFNDRTYASLVELKAGDVLRMWRS